MKQRLLSYVIVVPLLACQGRQQPEAPEEGAAPIRKDADATTPGDVYTAPEPEADEPISAAAPSRFFPENCLALKNADPSLPSGVYTIYPKKETMRDKGIPASCDMDTDGGGWTLVLNYNHQGMTNPALNIRTDSLPLLGSDLLGNDESLQPEFWGHAANEMLRSLTGFRELRFYCRSSENTRVLHFTTDDASCLSAVQLGTGGCADIKNHFVPMSDHTAVLPGAADRAEVDRMDQTLTYNTFGKTEVDTPARMWSVRAEPSQQAWECDYGTNNAAFHTLHRVWIR